MICAALIIESMASSLVLETTSKLRKEISLIDSEISAEIFYLANLLAMEHDLFIWSLDNIRMMLSKHGE